MLRRVLVALCCSLLAPAVSWAQRTPTIEVEEANLGLPPGRFIGEKDVLTQRAMPVFKPNVWAPLYLKLKLNKEVEGGIAAVITSVDGDGQKTSQTTPLMNNLGGRLPGTMIEPSELGVIPYVRCAYRPTGTQVTVTIISTAKNTFGRSLSPEFRMNNLSFRDASTFVVLSLGSRLPGFDLPSVKGSNPNTIANSTRSALRNGRVETAAITSVSEMPDQWQGYAAADLVVLTTGSATNDFLDDLFDPEKSRPFANRRTALLEHVRRGGNLVISVGGNALKLANSPLFKDLLPTRLSPDQAVENVSELLLSWTVAGTNVPVTALRSRNANFPVAKTSPIPGKPVRVLLEPKENDALAKLPIVAQSTYGLGRITLVAIDLDQSPFTEFSKRAEFWDYLLRNSTSERSALATVVDNQNLNNWGPTGYGHDVEDEFVSSLRAHVDYFEGVPVISFGWVALFILLYTLLIGPVEYVFLKYVLKRLELTWITFPLIVLSVSAAAYFTAYALKGSDLRTNKIDLLDIDLKSNRIFGQSWFTVFSPRVDKYSVSVEPRPEWLGAGQLEGPPTIDWMAGATSQGSGGLLGRSYDYQLGPEGEIATGIRDVRIPVWSTKSFTANWVGSTSTETPLIESNLIHPPGNPDAVSGSFTYNLPTPPVSGAVLFYRGTAYKLPTLTRGQVVTVPAIGADRGGLRSTLESDADWFNREAYLPNTSNTTNSGWGSQYNQPQNVATNVSLFGMMFHQKALGSDGRNLQNASLRTLDQSWRLSPTHREEVILVGRLAKTSGPAEEVMAGAEAPSPIRLWLKDLPGLDAEGQVKPRPPVPGSLQQETYFRVYIPIPPSNPKGQE